MFMLNLWALFSGRLSHGCKLIWIPEFVLYFSHTVLFTQLPQPLLFSLLLFSSPLSSPFLSLFKHLSRS